MSRPSARFWTRIQAFIRANAHVDVRTGSNASPSIAIEACYSLRLSQIATLKDRQTGLQSDPELQNMMIERVFMPWLVAQMAA